MVGQVDRDTTYPAALYYSVELRQPEQIACCQIVQLCCGVRLRYHSDGLHVPRIGVEGVTGSNLLLKANR